MGWETLDSPNQVEAYYLGHIDAQRWRVVLTGRPYGSFSAVFNGTDDSAAGGMLGIFALSGVTRISLALTLA